MRLLFFLAFPLFASLSTLIEPAESGDYMVMEMGKTLTLLAIRENTGDTLVFEEISAPLDKIKDTRWADWIQAKAPNHTSWTMTEVDLKTGEVIDCYSFSRASWVQLSSKESLFAALLHLELEKLSPRQQRKVGPPPMEGEPDRRRVWRPRMVFEGQSIQEPSYDVYMTEWPRDDSELSSAPITLYFDKEKRSALPFWIEAQTTHLLASLRTLDSGKHLPAIYRGLPKKSPAILKVEPLSLLVKCSKNNRQFDLFASEMKDDTRQLYPISYTLKDVGSGQVVLELDADELTATLTDSQKYRWILAPRDLGSFIESSQSFTFHLSQVVNNASTIAPLPQEESVTSLQ